MHCLGQPVKVLADERASGRDHALNLEVLAQILNHQTGLHGEFACWNQHKCLDLFELRVDLLNERDAVRCSLASSVLGTRDDVLACESVWDALFLDRRGELVAHFVDSLHNIQIESD